MSGAPIRFRTLCDAVIAAVRAMPDEAELGHAAKRLRAEQRINADEFLRLCALVGVDPVTGDPCPRQSDPGTFHQEMMLAAWIMTCHMREIVTVRAAAKASRVSASTITRFEQNRKIGIEPVIAICAFIGVSPFHYMQNEKRRAA